MHIVYCILYSVSLSLSLIFLWICQLMSCVCVCLLGLRPEEQVGLFVWRCWGHLGTVKSMLSPFSAHLGLIDKLDVRPILGLGHIFGVSCPHCGHKLDPCWALIGSHPSCSQPHSQPLLTPSQFCTLCLQNVCFANICIPLSH